MGNGVGGEAGVHSGANCYVPTAIERPSTPVWQLAIGNWKERRGGRRFRTDCGLPLPASPPIAHCQSPIATLRRSTAVPGPSGYRNRPSEHGANDARRAAVVCARRSAILSMDKCSPQMDKHPLSINKLPPHTGKHPLLMDKLPPQTDKLPLSINKQALLADKLPPHMDKRPSPTNGGAPRASESLAQVRESGPLPIASSPLPTGARARSWQWGRGNGQWSWRGGPAAHATGSEGIAPRVVGRVLTPPARTEPCPARRGASM